MADKSRQQEERAGVMKGSPNSNPQLQTGLMPHFGMASDSSLGLTTHHPLAYGLMHHQPINMGRVPSNPPNDMGPPIFMPSLNLGVPRVVTTTINQGSKPPKNSLNQQQYMPDVPIGFPPHSLVFHPSPMRQPSSYLSPNSPVNVKLTTSKPGTATKPIVSKTQIVRPTPKQPASTPPLSTKPSNAVTTRLKGEPPVDHVTYVHSPGSTYMLPQKGSTLSKMLMSPAAQQQQMSGVPSPEQKMEHGGAFVSNDTAPKTAIPTLSSIAASKGAAVAPDGYPGRQSDQVTTSGQTTSMASYTDTKNERPPQPSAAHPLSSQPLSQPPGSKDKSNIIIKGSTLTGRHIAAITNNTTIQHTGPGSMQPAYTQGTIPHTLDSVKSEYGPADTGWPHSPPEHATMATQIFNAGKEATNPPETVSGVLGLTTSPGRGGCVLGGSPIRSVGLLHAPGLGTSPRPQILRKRALDSSLSQGEFPPVPLSPTSEGGVANHNHVTSEIVASPRKKPRKQNMIANDDLYASNVPDSLSSSSASSLDTPLSVESEESGRSVGTSGSSSKSTRSKKESALKEDVSSEVEIRYLSQLRKSPYPISSLLQKASHKAPHNHFKQYSDIKHRDESRQSAVQLASDRYALQRAKGWRVHHALKQMKEMSRVEQELLDVTESLRSFSDQLKANSKCVIENKYLDSLKELVECNSVRSARVLSHVESTTKKSLQLLEHESGVSELLAKCSPPSSLPPHLHTNHHKTS